MLTISLNNSEGVPHRRAPDHIMVERCLGLSESKRFCFRGLLPQIFTAYAASISSVQLRKDRRHDNQLSTAFNMLM